MQRLILPLIFGAVLTVSGFSLDQFVGKYSSESKGLVQNFEIQKNTDGTYKYIAEGVLDTLQVSTKSDAEKLVGNQLKVGTFTGLISKKRPFWLIKSAEANERLMISKPGYFVFVMVGFQAVKKE